MIKVTVVTVCRNAARMLKPTIESVLCQSYNHLEYIIIDGGSTDGSLELIKSYKAAINYWISEPDNGIYDAMNKAISRATGKWIIFLNAGDTFANSSVIERVFRYDHTDVDVIYGDCIKIINGKTTIIPPHIQRNSHRMNFSHQCVFTRTLLLKKTPFDTHYRLSADFKSFKLIGLEGGTFKYIPIAISCFDTNGISNTHRADGLLENIHIIREVDSLREQIRLLPRICFTYLACRIRERHKSKLPSMKP